jgi:hypothetical protein
MLIPNLAMMTDAEVYGLSLSESEFAGAAKHVYECRLAIARIVSSERIVQDLATARNADQVEKLRERARAYVHENLRGRT